MREEGFPPYPLVVGALLDGKVLADSVSLLGREEEPSNWA